MTWFLHVDGDAFFAACEQAVNPAWRGKPVVVGGERTIATAISYEAKALGVTRGMPTAKIMRLYPECVICHTDFRLYKIFARRMYEIVRQYAVELEEYSIDECFATIVTPDEVRRAELQALVEEVRKELWVKLGISFSLGLGPTKVLAKIASNHDKPGGTVVIDRDNRNQILSQVPIGKVWGIGHRTAKTLIKRGVTTALEYTQRPFEWIQKSLSKPYRILWQELLGHPTMSLRTVERVPQSVTRSQTFFPVQRQAEVVWAQLVHNIAAAASTLRRQDLRAGRMAIMLKRSDFTRSWAETSFDRGHNGTDYLLEQARPLFDQIIEGDTWYRTTGVYLNDITPGDIRPDIFGGHQRHIPSETAGRVADAINKRFGKNTIRPSSSLPTKKRTRVRKLWVPYIGECV